MHWPHTGLYIAISPPLGHHHSFIYTPIYTHIIPTAPSGLDMHKGAEKDGVSGSHAADRELGSPCPQKWRCAIGFQVQRARVWHKCEIAMKSCLRRIPCCIDLVLIRAFITNLPIMCLPSPYSGPLSTAQTPFSGTWKVPVFSF